uniref:Integrase catalytic domain-containing protein n=1 Tax=Esox lucius TaxID=8010 RepID=A0AAY5JY58_ESOLU
VCKDAWEHIKCCPTCQQYKADNQKQSGYKIDCIIRILREEIFPVHFYNRVPKFIMSDRSLQFTGQVIAVLCDAWGICQKLTTSYHPLITNLTEMVNLTIKIMIALFVGEHHQSWDQWNLFRHQHGSTGNHRKGSCRKMIVEEVKWRGRFHHPRQAKYYNAWSKDVQFHQGDLVWVRTHPLSKAIDNFTAKLVRKWVGSVGKEPYFGVQPPKPPAGGVYKTKVTQIPAF